MQGRYNQAKILSSVTGIEVPFKGKKILEPSRQPTTKFDYILMDRWNTSQSKIVESHSTLA
jgi:hypothetical protein